VYLVVVYLKFLSKSGFSLSKLLVRIRVNLLDGISLGLVRHQERNPTQYETLQHQLELTFDG